MSVIRSVTWLGDLGGGSASLARRRIKQSTSVNTIFNNKTSDYGVMDNLEGDIGGYLVASGNNPGGAPIFSSGKGIADVIAEYVPLRSNAQWGTRAFQFAKALGAVQFDAYLSDINDELINAYIAVRDRVEELIEVLKTYQEKYLDSPKEFYMQLRDAQYNDDTFGFEYTSLQLL